MERRPLLAVGVAAAAGAAIAQPLDPVLRALLLAAVTSAAVWAAMQSGEPERIRLVAATALVMGAASAVLHARLQPQVFIAPHTVRVACTVLDAGLAESGGASYTCLEDAGPALAVNGPAPAPEIGVHLLVRGRIEPFDGPRNPGEPDERQIERERGLGAHMASAHILKHLPPAPLSPAIALARAHAWALAQLRLRLGEPYASIVAGELWGERGALPPELRAEFQETGTVHILVTAGLHLGVVALVTLALLRLLGMPRIATCTCATVVLWAYAAFSGFHLPVLRAASMISFALAAHAAGAASRSWNAYGAALTVFALFWPADVTSASFALSFSCVGAILLLGDQLGAYIERVAVPERVREALVLTIATQTGTWPLTASVFLLFSPYAALANLLVVPVVGFTMMIAGAQLASASLPALAQLLANMDSWLLAWIVAAVHTIATLPHATLAITPPRPWAIAAYDAAVIAAASLWRRDARTPALAALFVALTLVLAPPLRPDTRLRITVLDVGQADGIVIQTPRGHTILVDAGGRLERGTGSGSTAEQVGQRIVVPFLRRAGVKRIDALILSHPHGDHVGGCRPVIEALRVAEIADSGQTYGGHAYHDCIDAASAHRVTIVHPLARAVWRSDDGISMTFLGPSFPLITGRNAINDNSIAFILAYKHFRMLFTGDAGVGAERRFLDEGLDLRADVLKVGHHGSAYSSSTEFIAAVHPRYAVISVGRHNLFGHPSRSTIETLISYGAQVFRTDENGAVTFATDGERDSAPSVTER